jgi:hypothetical protein
MADLSLIKFEADLRAFAKIVDVNQATVVKKIAMDLWTAITLKTPVDTGRARAGWGLSIGTPIIPTPPTGSYPPNGQAPLPLPDISAINGRQIVYILNNVDYVQHLEDGTSQQAPAGMVRISIAEIELEIEAIVATSGQ